MYKLLSGASGASIHILDEDVCISHTDTTLGKYMNATINPPEMGAQ